MMEGGVKEGEEEEEKLCTHPLKQTAVAVPTPCLPLLLNEACHESMR